MLTGVRYGQVSAKAGFTVYTFTNLVKMASSVLMVMTSCNGDDIL